MDKQFDELSKSLAEAGVSRREALRKFGISLAGVLLAAVGLRGKAAAGNTPRCWSCFNVVSNFYVCSDNDPENVVCGGHHTKTCGCRLSPCIYCASAGVPCAGCQ